MSVSDEEELQQAIHERVEIREYDPEWPIRFAAECNRLRALCGDRLLSIEHIGSTAVPGLAAKPIVDIIAAVHSINDADQLIGLLCANGYSTSAEFNAALGDKRWLMRQTNGRRTHHLHLVLPASVEWLDKIRFRDTLRRDPRIQEAYLELKQRLAGELSQERESYTDAKTEFIRKVLDAQ